MLAIALGAPAPALAQSIERGEQLLKRHCADCHAVGARGRSPLGAAPALRDLHRRYEPEMLAEALAEGILTGHPAMPMFQFGPNDVQSIILYLDSIQTRARADGGAAANPLIR